ncbi:Acb2/Tad1 domain-containing protein [Paenibacillus sp. CFBP 13594]|uniref:Acb2/Tad1 domain-containing protein n=1 Tax=Paenibacillus sp. CFBP 13594 TaxID=2774037 RepID=UPI001FD25E58|nr:hypothetical protein [Paenibacillus sp. CFBP 13594]
MIKCVELGTGNLIGEVESIPNGNFEHIHNDYTYKFRHMIVGEVAFFTKNRYNITIENNFSYHSPKEGQPRKYEQIRNAAKELAYLLEDTVPNSREKSLAMTNLEQAVFWANAGIARNE